MKILTFALAALIMGAVLISGRVDLNLHHSHDLAGFDSYKVECQRDGLGHSCIVQLGNTIEDPSIYSKLILKLKEATARDSFKFLMVGNGGNATAALALHASIVNTKAQVSTEIIGPVYSAHTLLSFTKGPITIRPGAFIMVHHVNILNDDSWCQKSAVRHKSDRGQDWYSKCRIHNLMYLAEFKQVMNISVRPVLTKKEWEAVMEGFDVYIPSGELAWRLKGFKARDWSAFARKQFKQVEAPKVLQDWRGEARSSLISVPNTPQLPTPRN